MSGEGWVAIVLAFVGGLAWLFQLKGRIDTHEAVCAERYQNITDRLDEIKEQIAMLVEES